MEPKRRSLLELFIIYFIATLIGIASLVMLLVQVIRKGPSAVFTVKKRTVRPAALCGDEFGKHEFVRLKNSRMVFHYVVNGSEDKPLMLFLHGFPEFWYSWKHQLKEFSKSYRVVALDMKGYGETSKPVSVAEYYIDNLTADISHLITALGYDKCVLVGHDWGGMVAWMFTLRYQEMVERLIVCNCPHPAAYEDYVKTSLKQAMKSWYILFFQLPLLPFLSMRFGDFRRLENAFCGRAMGAKQGTFTQDDIECYKYIFNNFDDFVGPLNYYRAMVRYQITGIRERKISCPVLMAWGTKDGALDKPLAELSGRYADNYTLNYIDGASHWVQQEEPERVNEAIWKFLADKK